jgi:uncharacterized protein YaaQ
MKLIITIIRDTDDGAVVNQLVAHGYRVTRIASTGGFLRRGNVTLLIGAEADQVQAVIDLLQEACCSPAEPNQHRATVFVVDAQHFEQV